jgi:N-acyl homoserine lactone hydrolase
MSGTAGHEAPCEDDSCSSTQAALHVRAVYASLTTHPGVRAFREWVEPQQEIGPQLKRLGIGRGDVRWVVLTHLHTDHAGGLHHFPDNEIVVTRTDLEFASGLRGRVRGYVANQHWPSWFRPTTVELGPEPLGPFPGASVSRRPAT